MSFAEKLKRLCRTSLLISLIMSLVNGIYHCLKEGLFGRFFTLYSTEEKLFRKGTIGKFLSRKSNVSRWMRKIRLHLAEFFENSFIIEKVSGGATYLLGSSFRFYGIAVLTFGVYSVLMFYIKQYAFPNAIIDNVSLFFDFVMIAFGLLMMGSKQSIADLVQKGLIPHALLIDILGIPEERLDVVRVKRGGKYNISLIVGMLLGVFTLFVPSQYILLGICCLIAIAVIMSYPEIGVLALIAFLPFFGVIDLSFNLLNFGIGVVAFSYLSKLIRGKRVFRFSLIDTMMLFLILAVWFSGVASAGGEVSLQKAQHACLLMLMYFMIVNLIRTPKWLHRATLALIGASVILAFIGIFQYASEMKALASTDDFTAPWMIAQASSVFETSHAFGTYLMITIPLCMSVLITASGSKKRILAVLCFMIMIAAVVVTWSRGAWLGVLISLLIFFLIYSRKTACWLLIGGLTVPVWYSFLPSSFLSHFTDVLNLSDPAVYRQIYTWRGTLKMISNHLFGGIGYGTEAFCEVYPNYSIPGLELSESAGSLYLTIWSVMGLFGLLVFFAVMIVFAQHCFEYIGNASEPYSRTLVAAGFAGIMGTLIIGIGSDVWYHETVFMACVTVMALTCAYIRAGTLIRERNQDVSGSDFSHAHVDLHFEN